MSKYYKSIPYTQLKEMNFEEYNHLKYLMWLDMQDPKKKEQMVNQEISDQIEEVME